MIRRLFSKSLITDKKPVFIWGTGRCGSYLLYDILSLHPELCSPSTNGLRTKKGLWGHLHHGENIPTGIEDYPRPIEGGNLVWTPAGLPDKIHENDHDGFDQVDVNKVKAAYKMLCTGPLYDFSSKKCRILDKQPNYLLLVPLINKIYPDAFHVFCVRDPRLVVNSILRLMRFTSPDIAGPAYKDGFFGNMFPVGAMKRMDPLTIENLVWQVNALIRTGLSYSKILGERLILFRYESLHFHAHESIRLLFDCLELSPQNSLIQLLPDKFENYAPRWPTDDAKFKANEEISFDSSEKPYFDSLNDISARLNYDIDIPGKFNGEIER